jgi:hypothetical protein
MPTTLGFRFENCFREFVRRRLYPVDLVNLLTESNVIIALEGYTSENLDVLTDETSPLDYVSGPECLNNAYILSLKKHTALSQKDPNNHILYTDIYYDGDGGGDWGLSIGPFGEPLGATSRYIEDRLLHMKAQSFMQSYGLLFYPELVKLSYHLSQNNISHYMLHRFRGQSDFMIGHNPREDILISNGGILN